MPDDNGNPPATRPPALSETPGPVLGSQSTPPRAAPLTSEKPGRSRLSDEQLLKKAHYAARSLSVLGFLAAAGAVMMLAGSLFLAIKAPSYILVLVIFGAVSLGLVAAGYLALATAARRGNPKAVGNAIAVMGGAIALSFVSGGIVAAQLGTEFQLNMPGLIVPVLVLIALASNRNVLLELQSRGLWDQVFAAAKPSARLCVTGSILLATGAVALHANLCYTQWQAVQIRKVDVRSAKAFLQLIKTEENDFRITLRSLSGQGGKTNIDAVLAKVTILEQNLAKIRSEAAGTDKLVAILDLYATAVAQWRKGLVLLQQPGADLAKVNKMLTLGDKQRAEACRRFDEAYAARKPK